MNIQSLENIAWAPYETISNPTQDDWKKSYDALVQLEKNNPNDGRYPNTLGYICYYGRHTGIRDYAEARQWFEKGAALKMIESSYKLADMLIAGLGGDVDISRAHEYYAFLYVYCKLQLERGINDNKFADVALRLGRVFHEGSGVPKDDLTAIGYLLEAQFALDRRKPFHLYGDDTVQRNIQKLFEACKKPDTETRMDMLHELHLGRVPEYFLDEKHSLAFDISFAPDGTIRLEFYRIAKGGEKPFPVLWSIPPAMFCSLVNIVVLFGTDVRMIWNIKPGEPVVCDRYEYDEEHKTHQFFKGTELQCKLMDGTYYLSMLDLVKA